MSEVDLSAFEGSLFGPLIEFHTKTMTLLRSSPLDDSSLESITAQMKTVLDGVTAELTQTKDFNSLQERLDAAYDDVERMVNEKLARKHHNNET